MRDPSAALPPRRAPARRLACGVLGALAACSPPGFDPTPPPGPEPALAPAEAVDPLEAAIEAHWQAAGVLPTTPADDAEFLRRASLDLVGRIPTPDEVSRFVADPRPDKRAAVVDAWLAGDEFAEHWGDVLTDTLLDGAVDDRPRLRDGLHTWLREQLTQGRGWDEVTTALLTAEGELPPAGPSGFLLAHGRQNRVEALTGQTARVFLGLQLQCAQCHDDPDERFTQAQFYGLAAYYARTRARFTKLDGERVPRIVDKPRGEMRMPTELDAPGDRTGPRVDPAFPALALPTDPGETRRQTLAAGVIGSPLFAKAAANHAWARLLGRGIVEPWDDLGGLAGDDHPPLLEHLATELRAHDHDLRWLLRRITLSSAYQRSSRGAPEGAEARRDAFAQAAVRPMTSTQLLRSMLLATGLHDVQGRAFRREVDTRRQRLRREYAQVFDDDEMASADDQGGNVPQALLLLNGELTNQGVAADRGALTAILREHDDPDARLDALFIRLYGRPLAPARRSELRAFLDQRDHRPAAYADLMHAMLVSSEFLTLH